MPPWRRSPPAEPAPDTLERALAHEILVSERLRVTILAGVLCLLSAAYLMGTLLVPDSVPILLPQWRSLVMPLLGTALVYELVVRGVIGYALRTGRQPPAAARYVNALIETSLPTLATLILAWISHPVYALSYPATSFYFLFILVATLRLDFRLCAFTGLVAAVEYMVMARLFIGQTPPGSLPAELMSPIPHASRGVLFLVTGVIAGLVGLQIKQQFLSSFRSVEERNRVVSMFGQHVSPVVVDKLMTQDLELGGEVRHVCLMFLDIRDFTRFAATRSPDEVVAYLNGLFEFMIESVNRHSGIVNIFLGDGFMAVFGAPISNGRDVRDAVAAALEIVERVEEANAAGELSPTRIGIGLHAGEAVTGNVGSSLRKEYTIIGNSVNLAARIEQLNKEYSSRLLVSEAVWQALDGDAVDAVPLGPVQIRGHDTAVEIYRLA